MKPPTITAAIMRSLHRKIERRHRATGDRGLLAVGLGWATKHGRPDLARGMVFLYVVRRKRKRVPVKHRVPKTVTVSLRRSRSRGRPRVQLTLGTDVVEARNIVQTGFAVNAGGKQFTCGALLSWTEEQSMTWGVLTVGHGVSGAPGGSATITLPDGSAITGTVYASTLPTDVLDAALISISAADAASVRTAAGMTGTQTFTCRTIDQLLHDGRVVHPTGFSLRVNGTVLFNVYGYLPRQSHNDPIIAEAPNRENLLFVQGNPSEFAPGTSGSVWIAAGTTVDAIQIAAYADNFARGIGQPMEEYLKWASLQVGGRVSPITVF